VFARAKRVCIEAVDLRAAPVFPKVKAERNGGEGGRQDEFEHVELLWDGLMPGCIAHTSAEGFSTPGPDSGV
jgi:hypothetical protein